MISPGRSYTLVTSRVFWAVIAVIAVQPYTPRAEKVLRSAWMPAPAPESLPAIDNATLSIIEIGYTFRSIQFIGQRQMIFVCQRFDTRTLFYIRFKVYFLQKH